MASNMCSKVTGEMVFKDTDDLESPSRRKNPPHMHQLAQIPELKAMRHQASMGLFNGKNSLKSTHTLSKSDKDLSGNADPSNMTPSMSFISKISDLSIPQPEQPLPAAPVLPTTASILHTNTEAPPSLYRSKERLHDLAKLEHEEWKENQNRIGSLIAENDHLLQQNRQTEHEANMLKNQVAQYSRTVNTHVMQLDEAKEHTKSLEAIIAQLKATQTSLEEEVRQSSTETAHSQANIESLQTQIQKKRGEINMAELKISDLKKAVTDITDRYQMHIKESAEHANLERELVNEIKIKAESIQEYQARVKQHEKQIDQMKQEISNKTSINKKLEKKIEEMERAELISIENCQRQTQEMEEFCFERDKALKREAQLQVEVASLSKKLDDMPAKYAEKNEITIQLIRGQFNVDRRKFLDETSKLETLCATLQAQSERAIREKRAAESELDRLTRHIPAEADRLSMLVEEVHAKLRISERERVEALHKVESIHQNMTRESNNYEVERSQLAASSEEAYRRLRKVEHDLQEAKNDQISMLSKIATLEHEKKSELEAKTKKQVAHDAAVASLVAKKESIQSELGTKLEQVTEAHSKTCRDMQALLSDQRRLGDKWKEESSRITEQYEISLSHLRNQIVQHQAKITELEVKLHKANAQHRDLMDQISHEKRELGVLHSRCINSEGRVESLSRQVGVLVGKEAELIEDRRRLQRDLDLAIMERDRFKRDARYHAKQDMSLNNAFLRAKTDVTDAMMQSEAVEAFGKEANTQVRDLEADIARVTQRSMTGHHQYKRQPLKSTGLSMNADLVLSTDSLLST
ncbi:hypothetical protein BDV3_006600 [Batrachochytrium dendrobatidis]